MATNTASLAPDSSTDAAFRAWGSAFEALIETGGFWSKQADTGTIDWTTVLTPAGGALAGFEIYKTVDTLSSEFAFYMKVEYGANLNVPKGPFIRVSFGTGSDGAGVLIGTVTPAPYKIYTDVSGTGTTGDFFASGNPGRWGMLGWVNNVNANFAFGMVTERSVDSTGAYTSEYVTVCLAYRDRDGFGGFFNVVVQRTHFKPSLGGWGPELQANLMTLTLTPATTGVGSDETAFPVFPMIGRAGNMLTQLLGFKLGDTSELAETSVTLYGGAKNYKFSNRGTVLKFSNTSGFTDIGWALRYE